MTYKNAKTMLFAGLIAAMILPFSGMMMADAAPSENASDKAKEQTDKIPTDKLIERTVDKWASKYNTTEEFQAKTSYVKK